MSDKKVSWDDLGPWPYVLQEPKYTLSFTAPVDGLYRYNGKTFELVKGDTISVEFKPGEGLSCVASLPATEVALPDDEQVQGISGTSDSEASGESEEEPDPYDEYDDSDDEPDWDDGFEEA